MFNLFWRYILSALAIQLRRRIITSSISKVNHSCYDHKSSPIARLWVMNTDPFAVRCLQKTIKSIKMTWQTKCLHFIPLLNFVSVCLRHLLKLPKLSSYFFVNHAIHLISKTCTIARRPLLYTWVPRPQTDANSESMRKCCIVLWWFMCSSQGVVPSVECETSS